jgi:hypothetical protein
MGCPIPFLPLPPCSHDLFLASGQRSTASLVSSAGMIKKSFHTPHRANRTAVAPVVDFAIAFVVLLE